MIQEYEDVCVTFEHYDDEYLEFDRIPQEKRLHENSEICGILKLYSLCETPLVDFAFCAEHDVLYIVHREHVKYLTNDDVIYLLRCGICFDQSEDCFKILT